VIRVRLPPLELFGGVLLGQTKPSAATARL